MNLEIPNDATASSDTVTAISHVTFEYQADEDNTPDLAVAGVKDINLEFPPGSCTLVTGPSGSGKSTLLRLLNGLIPELFSGKLEGDVRLGGLDTVDTDIQQLGRAAGTVFQNPRSQFFTATVYQEFAFACENAGDMPTVIRQRLEQVARIWGIEPPLEYKLKQLSGGEQQLVTFATALIGSQRIVLLDESTSSLSLEAIDGFAVVFAGLKREGWTVVVAEHRLYPLRGLADRIVVMRDGTVVTDQPAAEFLASSDTRHRELGLRILIPPQQHCFKETRVGVTDVSTHEEATQETPARAIPGKIASGSGVVVENLRFSYGKTRILDIPRLEVPAGTVTVLTGANGAERTTLARTLIGSAHPEKDAHIYFNGQRCRSRQRTKRSALVMQDVNQQLFEESVLGEVTLGNTEVSVGQAREILTELGLGGLGERHPMTLSGGQKQRLVITNAIAGDAELYVFNEPTSGVDYGHLMSISRLIHRLAVAGKAVPVISHDWKFLSEVIDRELRLSPLREAIGRGQIQVFDAVTAQR